MKIMKIMKKQKKSCEPNKNNATFKEIKPTN